MRGLLDYNQTSGNEWSGPSGEVLYHGAQDAAYTASAHLQLVDLADLDAQMRHFEADHEGMISDLRKQYVFRNESALSSFFRGHRTIPQLLMQAVPHLRKHFGGDTVFNLKVPIDASGSRMLYAVALWPGSINDVRRALADFDDSWWFATARQASGNLTFTYELV